MKKEIAIMTFALGLGLANLAYAESLDLSGGLKNSDVEMDTASGDGQLDVTIPAGDKVFVRLVKSDVDTGCKSLGVSNGGMAWTVSLQIGEGAQGESCTFKITEDGQSANVTLSYSASDD